jgi:outer membrane protein OmpA-like peptidoglycan-associated protein
MIPISDSLPVFLIAARLPSAAVAPAPLERPMPLTLRSRFLAGACACLIVPCVASAAPQAKPGAQAKPSTSAKPAAPAKPPSQGSLGSKDPGLFNLTGTIYFLTDKETRMPKDLATRKTEGTIFTDTINVPSRNFTTGFPGVTDRFAWFGILYTGRFFVDVPGEYGWQLQSDDGSRLWIDGKEVIDYDGVHGFGAAQGKIELTKGPHDVRLWYFQGPPTEIGLVLKVKPPNEAPKVFNLADFAGPMAEALKTLKAEATPDGIRIRLDAALLFDTAKWDLKPAAAQAIKNLSQVIAAYPAALIRVVGFTDAVGGDDYNLDLSRSRATSVKDALVALNPPAGVTFETEGLGKAKPVASNDTPAGRALNRRVEVFIKPQAAAAIDATALPGVQTLPKAPAPAPAPVAAPPVQATAPPVQAIPPVKAAPPAQAAPQPPPARVPPPASPRPNSPEMIAAVNRVKNVIERYAQALSDRNEEALREVRAGTTDAERALLQAKAAKVTIEVSTVDVSGTSATATCQQSIDATAADGKPVKTVGAVVFVLVRQPTGWIITDIR